MTEKEFLSLLLEMVKRDEHPQKTRILELLGRSSLSFDKTEIYTRRKWNYFKEYIYLEPVHTIDNLRKRCIIESCRSHKSSMRR